jgi:KDO2-lipid IV(A) lauroyltransferase
MWKQPWEVTSMPEKNRKTMTDESKNDGIEYSNLSRRLYGARESLEIRLVSAAGAAMERASWRTCRVVGARLGLVFYAALRHRRAVAVGNVQRAFPDLGETAARRIVRRSCQNFAMTFCEFLHLRVASREDVRAYCSAGHMEYIQQAIDEGHGTLFFTAHLGNWELLGARAAQEFPLSVIARPTGNTGVENHVAAVRAAAGMKVISKFDTGRASLRALKRGEALAILPDQHAGQEGALLPFFGHPTRMVTAVARLSLLSGAPVVPTFGVRQGPWIANGKIAATIEPSFHVEKTHDREADVLEGTRRIVHELETVIRRHPDQWLWLHRRWRASDLKAVARANTDD